jgi:hypothetical protein
MPLSIDLSKVILDVQSSPNAGDIPLEYKALLQATVELWQKGHGFIPSHSFGCVVANPAYAGRYYNIWDNPEQLFSGALVLGWGPESTYCVADSIRKIRVTARTGLSSWDVQYHHRGLIANEVLPAVEDASCPWGDLPLSGALLYRTGADQRLIGTGGLSGAEDELISLLVGGLFTLSERHAELQIGRKKI